MDDRRTDNNLVQQLRRNAPKREKVVKDLVTTPGQRGAFEDGSGLSWASGESNWDAETGGRDLDRDSSLAQQSQSSFYNNNVEHPGSSVRGVGSSTRGDRTFISTNSVGLKDRGPGINGPNNNTTLRSTAQHDNTNTV